MASEKAPTKADFLAALEKKGIRSLEDLIDAVMPEPDETGGYLFAQMDMGEGSDPYEGAAPGFGKRRGMPSNTPGDHVAWGLWKMGDFHLGL